MSTPAVRDLLLGVASKLGSATEARWLVGQALGSSGVIAQAASGIAATFYAANCTDDAPLFVATWYPLAIAMVVAAGYGVGSISLKW